MILQNKVKVEGEVTGSKGNDVYIINLGKTNVQKSVGTYSSDNSSTTDVIKNTQGGTDKIQFVVSDGESFTLDSLETYQPPNTKDLVLSYLDGESIKTVTVENYYKSIDGKTTKSSVKEIELVDSNGNVLESSKLTDVVSSSLSALNYSMSKKGVTTVTGTVFSDVIYGTNAVNVNRADYSKGEFEYGEYIYSKNDALENVTTVSKGQFEYGGKIYNEKTTESDKVVVNSLSGKDIIKAGAGNDIIYSGTGDDIIYGGEGKNTIVCNTGDGNDTVYLTKGEKLELVVNASEISYSFQNNDLIITYAENNNLGDSEALSTDSITIKNYVKNDVTEYIKINGNDLRDEVKNNIAIEVTGKKVNGTSLTEIFNITRKTGSTVQTGAGNDTVYAGSGNDTINLNGAGSKTLVFGNGTGKDTVNLTSSLATADLKFEDDENLSYTKSGNNLVITHDYDEDVSPDKIILKNYFKNDNYQKFSINNNLISDIVVESNKKKNNNINLSSYDLDFDIYDGSKNDTIKAGNGNNSFTYSGGKDSYISGTGDDKYNVNFGENTKLIISDKGGTDSLVLQDADTLALFFNIKLGDENQGVVSDSSLMIFNSDSLSKKNISNVSGAVKINDYFGEGKIESVSVSMSNIDMDNWINNVISDVSSWLSDKGYSDTSAVFESNNADDISNLIQVYQTVTK